LVASFAGDDRFSNTESEASKMPLVSGFTVIRALSLFHITAAYFFLTAPRMLADQNVVFVLGESVRLVCFPSMSTSDNLLIRLLW